MSGKIVLEMKSEVVGILVSEGDFNLRLNPLLASAGIQTKYARA